MFMFPGCAINARSTFLNAPESMIGDALGHGGNSRVTKDYFAGFNEEIIHKATDSLLAFSS